MLSLYFLHYNFCRIHETLKMSPAMAAGMTDQLWEIGDIVSLVEAEEAKQPRKRGPVRKRIQSDPSPLHIHGQNNA